MRQSGNCYLAGKAQGEFTQRDEYVAINLSQRGLDRDRKRQAVHTGA